MFCQTPDFNKIMNTEYETTDAEFILKCGFCQEVLTVDDAEIIQRCADCQKILTDGDAENRDNLCRHCVRKKV